MKAVDVVLVCIMVQHCKNKIRILPLFSGAPAPSLMHQLSCCQSQMDNLLTGMSNGMLSVTKLTLQVSHLHVDTGERSAQEVSSGESLRLRKVPCPGMFSVVTRSIFSALAAALPKLESLSLQGPCWDAALPVFGTFCSQLTSLCVQALTVPVSTLEGFSHHLPNLTSFSMRNHIMGTEQEQLGFETDAILLELQHCSKLASLCLSFSTPLDFSLTCKPASWSSLPASLQQLEITCPVSRSGPYDAVLRRMKHLRLWEYPWDLPRMLQASILMDSLETMGEGPVTQVNCMENLNESPWNVLMKERLLNGTFHLACYALCLNGTTQAIRDTLAWFPAVPACVAIVINLQGGQKVNLLERISDVFPGVRRLMLQGPMVEAPNADMDMTFFKPLEKFLHLKELRIYSPRPRLTTAGLLELCVKYARLSKLGLTPHARVDVDELQDGLCKRGCKVKINRLNGI